MFTHRLALRSQNSTVVILPSGLKELYPRSLQSWIGREGVLFVTEYPDDLKMFKSHFYDRNRIIVALSPITLVVQASEKSGSMISARLAMDLGRRVLTLPASPMDRAFAGNNMLLFDGAEMVRNRQDLLGIFSQTYINSNSASKGKGLLAEE
jgi:DNA processing protein